MRSSLLLFHWASEAERARRSTASSLAEMLASFAEASGQDPATMPSFEMEQEDSPETYGQGSAMLVATLPIDIVGLGIRVVSTRECVSIVKKKLKYVPCKADDLAQRWDRLPGGLLQNVHTQECIGQGNFAC